MDRARGRIDLLEVGKSTAVVDVAFEFSNLAPCRYLENVSRVKGAASLM